MQINLSILKFCTEIHQSLFNDSVLKKRYDFEIIDLGVPQNLITFTEVKLTSSRKLKIEIKFNVLKGTLKQI